MASSRACPALLSFLTVTAVAAHAQETKLLAADGDPGDQLGLGLALDGDTALVGAYADDVWGVDSGSAYVYRRQGSAWVQEAKLVPPSGAANDNFGLRVALSGDLAAVGCPLDDSAGTDAGSVVVFQRTGTSWSYETTLTASEAEPGDQFGRWVHLHRNRLAVSVHLDDPFDRPDAGSAYVFRRDGPGTWVREGHVFSSRPAAGNWFARSVAIHGTTLVVGEPRNDELGTDAGRAHVFEYLHGSWRRTATLAAPDAAAGDQFGAAVSSAGGRVAVGAIKDDHGGRTDAGSAYVYRRARTSPWALPVPPVPVPAPIGFRHTTWTFEDKVVAMDAGDGDQFGRGLALSGPRLLASAIFADPGELTDAGRAYVFERSGTSWSQAGTFVPMDAADGDLLGYTVALDGTSACVGAYLDDNARGVDAGCAYVFDVGELGF